MKKIGMLSKRSMDVRPAVYDPETRIVSLDIEEIVSTDVEGAESVTYEAFQVEIDSLKEYGHIKSQLIEAAFAPKDEIALLANATKDILAGALSGEGVEAFRNFDEWRSMCAVAAHTIVG